NGTATTYTYDAAGQLTSDGTNTYTYDAAGNLTAAGANTYTWDWANRLASSTVAGTSTSYQCAGDNLRTSKQSGATTTNYLWDREAGDAELVDDGSQSYLHADGVQEQIDRSGQPQYLLGDSLGSVRGVTDGSGTLTGSADYGVFGTVRSRSGQSSIFGFVGEQTDSETGFSYLRARYYDPSTGRFLSADSSIPNAAGTQGYN